MWQPWGHSVGVPMNQFAETSSGGRRQQRNRAALARRGPQLLEAPVEDGVQVRHGDGVAFHVGRAHDAGFLVGMPPSYAPGTPS